jgi:hypothetical protein
MSLRNSPPYAWLPTDAPTRARIFLVNEWQVSEETRIVILRLLLEISTRRSTSESGTGKDYLSRYLRSPAKSTFKCLYKQTPLWHVIMRKMPHGPLKIKMTARKGGWAISPNSRALHPLRFKAVGYYRQSNIWHPLGLTLRRMPNGKGPLRNPLQRISLRGRSALSNWTKCKEPAGTWSSAKSASEVDQKLLSDKQQ